MSARLVEESRELAYRIYLTDELFLSAQNKRHTRRFYDLLNHPEAVETRSGEEIAEDIMARGGLKFG